MIERSTSERGCASLPRMSFPRRTIVLALACALTALLPAAALGALTPESVTVFQGQLSHGQVHAVVFHQNAHKMHVSLNGGGKVVVAYAPSQQQQLYEQAKARGASVLIVKKKTTKPATHHKLRYIAGGIVVVVIVVVVAVLLYDRRRKLRAEEEGPAPAVRSGSQ